MLVSFVVGFVDGVIGIYNYESGFGYLGIGYSLVVLIFFIVVGVCCMYDVGKSGWFLFILIYNLILVVMEGEVGFNEYGLDFKNLESDLVDYLVS